MYVKRRYQICIQNVLMNLPVFIITSHNYTHTHTCTHAQQPNKQTNIDECVYLGVCMYIHSYVSD